MHEKQSDVLKNGTGDDSSGISVGNKQRGSVKDLGNREVFGSFFKEMLRVAKESISRGKLREKTTGLKWFSPLFSGDGSAKREKRGFLKGILPRNRKSGGFISSITKFRKDGGVGKIVRKVIKSRNARMLLEKTSSMFRSFNENVEREIRHLIIKTGLVKRGLSKMASGRVSSGMTTVSRAFGLGRTPRRILSVSGGALGMLALLGIEGGMLLVKGMFSFGKTVIKGIWSFVKFVTKSVVGTIGFVLDNVLKPILPYFIKFLLSPPGAFIAGYLSHMLYSKADSMVKNLFPEVGGIKDGLKTLFGNIYELLSNLDFGKIMTTLSIVGSSMLFPLLKSIVEGLNPVNLAWRGAKKAIGSALGWSTHLGKVSGIVKAAAMNPVTWVAAASIGLFVAMGTQLADTVANVKQKDTDNKHGRFYARKLSAFGNIKNKFRDGMGEMFRNNKSVLMELTGKENSQKLGISGLTDFSKKDVNDTIRDALYKSSEDEENADEMDKIIDFCQKESENLSEERQSIIDSAGKDESRQRNMGYETRIRYNGKFIITDRLPDGVSNPI